MATVSSASFSACTLLHFVWSRKLPTLRRAHAPAHAAHVRGCPAVGARADGDVASHIPPMRLRHVRCASRTSMAQHPSGLCCACAQMCGPLLPFSVATTHGPLIHESAEAQPASADLEGFFRSGSSGPSPRCSGSCARGTVRLPEPALLPERYLPRSQLPQSHSAKLCPGQRCCPPNSLLSVITVQSSRSTSPFSGQ